MAVCFLASCGRTRLHLGVSPLKLLRLRSGVGFSGTAAERHNTGHECHNDDGDDGDDDHGRSVMHVRMLETRANKLEEQVQDLTQRYQRALADSDNVRRRTQKFVEDAKRFGIQSFCRDLVEVADLVERTVHGTEADTQAFAQNLELIQNRLQQVFTKHGLEKMNVVGAAYDPYEHEIVCHIPADGLEPGNIAIVKQDGYKLHGRTIRFAHVGIAVKAQES